MFSVTLASMLVRSVSVALRCPSDWLCLLFLQLLVSLALYLKSITLARSSVEIFIYTSPELGLFVNDLSCFMIWKDTLFIHIYFEFTFLHICRHLSIFDLWTQLICISKITVLSKTTTTTKRCVIKPYRLKLACTIPSTL